MLMRVWLFFFHVPKGKRSRGSLSSGNPTPRDAGEKYTHNSWTQLSNWTRTTNLWNQLPPSARPLVPLGWKGCQLRGDGSWVSIVRAVWWAAWQRDAALTTGWLCANIQTKMITGWEGRERLSWASSHRIATVQLLDFFRSLFKTFSEKLLSFSLPFLHHQLPPDQQNALKRSSKTHAANYFRNLCLSSLTMLFPDGVCVCVCSTRITKIYSGIVLSHKKEWDNAVRSNVDGPRDYHTKWGQTEEDKYYMISLTCGISKIIQMNLFTRQK